jgi:very-short-patch-repair endonuclease
MPALTPLGAVGELAASRHGAFSRRQAASFNVKRADLDRLLRDRVIRELAPGVFVFTGAPASWRRGLAVATLCCNEAGVVGFESAAQLHGVDGYRDDRVVLVLTSPRRIHLEGVTVHVGPLAAIDITQVDGIRCTTVERTLCDLGSVSSDFRVKLAFEWYWRRAANLVALQATVDRLHRPGQHGTKAIQELLVAARLDGRPTGSALEVRLEAIIGDIEGIVRQYEVFDRMGRFVARPDFAIPALRVAIEAHSRQHHQGFAARDKDQARHEALVANDWRVQYVTAKQMDDPAKVRSGIRTLIKSTDSPTLPTWP